MAHHRRTIGAATLLNTAISVGEGCVAFYSGSLSVLVDSVHNLGDVGVSLAPVAAGLMITFNGRPMFDPLVGLGVGLWLVVSTVRALLTSSGGDLLWPEEMSCGQPKEA